jgi:hypothetical protein
MRARRLLPFFLLLPGGCSFFIPQTHTPAERAQDVAKHCAAFTEEATASLRSPSAIDTVEPAYSYLESGPGNREARLRGARIHLHPIAAMSRESIARSLECHESRVVLGSASPLVDDPYALAGAWLDIDVDSEKDGFVVQVGTDDISAAHEVLERTKRFAVTREPH